QFLLDEESTIRMANIYFDALMRFGESPSTGKPPSLPKFSHRFGWWVYNPVGKSLLDGLLVDLVPAMRDIEKQKAEIAVAKNALLHRVRGVLGQSLQAPRSVSVPRNEPIRSADGKPANLR